MSFEQPSSKVEVSPEYQKEAILKFLQKDIERLKGAKLFMERKKSGESSEESALYNLTVEELGELTTSEKIGDRIAELKVIKDEVEQGNLEQAEEFMKKRMSR